MALLCNSFGQTKLVFLPKISEACNAKIYVKLENTNPGGGSIKDRVSLNLIETAEKEGKLKPGGTVVEGTGGNTGLGIVTVANAKGYKSILCMPEAISKSKIAHMRALGADVRLCPPVPPTDDAHYAKMAKMLGQGDNTFHTDQFLNLANMEAHVKTTGPEVFSQMEQIGEQNIDCFCAAAGTGGTIAGVGKYLKSRDSAIHVILNDCDGSCLKRYIGEGEILPRDGESGTTAEGIGCGRLTGNFAEARKYIDGAISISDAESIAVAFFLLQHEGIFAGPSAALNVAGAMKNASFLQQSRGIECPVVVTIICDGGASYLEKAYSPTWRAEKGFAGCEVIPPGGTIMDLLDSGNYVPKASDDKFEGHVGGS